jgi:hypothetical protein
MDLRAEAVFIELQQVASRQNFEQEKAEFLTAIQENMQILDGMLKHYATKSNPN